MQIFISYRRDDASGHAGRLYDRLSETFGSGSLFMDVDTIGAGQDFVEVVRDAITSSDVVLAVIGPRWSTVARGDGSRRLDDPDDPVRLEIETALEAERPIIPVLVQAASMPSASQLPEALRPLTRRNAVDVSDTRWRSDVDRLIGSIEQTVDAAPRTAERPTQPPTEPGRSGRPRSARTLALVLGIAVIGVVAIWAVAASRGGGSAARETAGPSTATGGEGGTAPDGEGTGIPPVGVVAIDVTTGDVIASVDTSFAPDVAHPSIAIGEGGVWARDPRIVTHIDPSSGTVEASIPLSGGAGNPGNIAIGFRTVWVGTSSSIERINPADDRPLKAVRVGGQSIVVGIGHVWTLAEDGTLGRIDPVGARLETSADVATDGSALATGGGVVWVLDGLAGTVVPVDPVTMEAGAAIPVPGDPRSIEFLDGLVWVLDPNAGTVTSVDPDSGRASASIRVGEEPSEFTTGLGALWVADQGGALWKIDPLTDTSTSLEVGGPLAAVAIDERTQTAWAIVATLSLT